MNAGLGLQLRIPAEWTRIDAVRQAVASCLAVVSDDGDLKNALSMVSAELLENAVKYGKPDRGGIAFTMSQESDRLVMSVTNAVDEPSSHLGALRRRLEWIESFPDPSKAYVAALAEVYDDPTDARDGSGLGMVRIAYEGHCRLECDTSVPGRVTVRAAYERRPTPGG